MDETSCSRLIRAEAWEGGGLALVSQACDVVRRLMLLNSQGGHLHTSISVRLIRKAKNRQDIRYPTPAERRSPTDARPSSDLGLHALKLPSKCRKPDLAQCAVGRRGGNGSKHRLPAANTTTIIHVEVDVAPLAEPLLLPTPAVRRRPARLV